MTVPEEVAFAFAAGQPVRRGQVVGTEGSVGHSAGSHLHVEVRLNAAYQNPLSFWT
ncbi:MAG TPA: M23 family metallopeptidase [Candidatus Dormibacteraeota bacterium]|nr:M23 family metallopeptidase [Candidatus Dormibacteraeota bacterium]